MQQRKPNQEICADKQLSIFLYLKSLLAYALSQKDLHALQQKFFTAENGTVTGLDDNEIDQAVNLVATLKGFQHLFDAHCTEAKTLVAGNEELQQIEADVKQGINVTLNLGLFSKEQAVTAKLEKDNDCRPSLHGGSFK